MQPNEAGGFQHKEAKFVQQLKSIGGNVTKSAYRSDSVRMTSVKGCSNGLAV